MSDMMSGYTNVNRILAETRDERKEKNHGYRLNPAYIPLVAAAGGRRPSCTASHAARKGSLAELPFHRLLPGAGWPGTAKLPDPRNRRQLLRHDQRRRRAWLWHGLRHHTVWLSYDTLHVWLLRRFPQRPYPGQRRQLLRHLVRREWERSRLSLLDNAFRHVQHPLLLQRDRRREAGRRPGSGDGRQFLRHDRVWRRLRSRHYFHDHACGRADHTPLF